MFELTTEGRIKAHLSGIDAISVNDSCVCLSDLALSRIGDRIEFAVGGTRVLALKKSINGYAVTDNRNDAHMVGGSIAKRLLASVMRGQYVYHAQQGPWSIYKMEE